MVLGVIVLALFALVNEQVPIESARPLDIQAGGLLALSAALLLASRRFPATVAALVLGVSVVWYSRYGSRLIDLPALVAFFVLGTTGDRRRQLAVGGLSVALLAGAVVGSPSDEVELAIEGVGWTVAAILGGELVRSRRLLLDEYAARAARAEAERDAEAERRVAGERLRVARDLHDVLAHTVSLMTVQAGVAADALERGTDRGAVRAALATLRSAGREAMAEVRATVAVLRGTGTGVDQLDTAPAPDLARVPELVDAARSRGHDLDIELDVDVAGVEVESLVGLTAYRVVQESLTNVARHAGAARAAVRIHGDGAGRLVVEVVDDGPRGAGGPPAPGAGAGTGEPGHDLDGGGTPVPGPGFGLRGMSERVEAVGGELSYGPLPGRGWAVRATLPARASPASPASPAATGEG